MVVGTSQQLEEQQQQQQPEDNSNISSSNDDNNTSHYHYDAEVVSAVVDSRVTRKGRRVAREKLTSDGAIVNDAAPQSALGPGAFEVTVLANCFNVNGFLDELESARTRMEEMRAEGAAAAAHNSTRASSPHIVVGEEEEEEDASLHEHDEEEARALTSTMSGSHVAQHEQVAEPDSNNMEGPESMVTSKMKISGRRQRQQKLALWTLVIGLLVTVATVFALALSNSRNKTRNSSAADVLDTTNWPTQAPVPHTIQPTRTPWMVKRVLSGEHETDRMGDSVSLSGDGSVLAYTVPGNYSVVVQHLSQVGDEPPLVQVITNALSPPELVRLTEDGDFLVIAGKRHIEAYRFTVHSRQWQRRGQRLDTALLFTQDDEIVSMSVQSNSTTIYVALGFIRDGEEAGTVAVFEQISQSWTPKGSSLSIPDELVNLFVRISFDANLIAVGILPLSARGDLKAFVWVYRYNGTTDSYTVTEKFVAARTLKAVHLVSCDNVAILTYMDTHHVQSIEISSQDGTQIRSYRRFSPSTETSISPDFALEVARDRKTLMLGWIDAASDSSPKAVVDEYQFDEDWGGYFFRRRVGFDNPSTEYMFPASISLSLSSNSTMMAVGQPDMEKTSVDKDIGYVILFEQP